MSPTDYVPVDHDGDTLLLTEPEARLYERAHSPSTGLGANVEDTIRDALEALGRLRTERLAEVAIGLDAARARIRVALINATEAIKDELPGMGSWPHKVGGLDKLVTAYVRLGGDLELEPSPAGPSPFEEAAVDVVKVAYLHSPDEFPARLEDLVAPLSALEEVYRQAGGKP